MRQTHLSFTLYLTLYHVTAVGADVDVIVVVFLNPAGVVVALPRTP